MFHSDATPAALIKGLATFLPGVNRLANRGTGGSDSARYCYSVWLRHLVRARHADPALPIPAAVGEFGPGDSLGAGLAALLSGADAYYAFDAKAHARPERNLAVLATLIQLFSQREPIPDDVEFPHVIPKLSDYRFPHSILPDDALAVALRAERLGAIRRSLEMPSSQGTPAIRYIAPWSDTSLMAPGTLDFLWSQAVMEHVDDIRSAYRAMHAWLRPGGFLSHSVDYDSHGHTRTWNGHWTVPRLTWRIARGNRTYFINRQPHSAQRSEMQAAGFAIVCDERMEGPPLPRHRLAAEFRHLDDVDLRTSGAFLQAVKPRHV